MVEQCKEQISTDEYATFRQCKRKAKINGYCLQHSKEHIEELDQTTKGAVALEIIDKVKSYNIFKNEV